MEIGVYLVYSYLFSKMKRKVEKNSWKVISIFFFFCTLICVDANDKDRIED